MKHETLTLHANAVQLKSNLQFHTKLLMKTLKLISRFEFCVPICVISRLDGVAKSLLCVHLMISLCQTHDIYLVKLFSNEMIFDNEG